ncbi:MAG: hypothetical protein JWM80_97 [Cyanobacteria bacterium RYN_339]|nr:hypothetical protein [Cyanobacteria bacterium RYN_339]
MRSALLLALCAVLAAPPAFARVDDCCDQLSPELIERLQADLDRIDGHHFDVAFLPESMVDIEEATRALFVQRGLGTGDGLVVVFAASKRVAVHLGDSFKDHGVGTEEIRRTLRSEFAPYAKVGRYDDASRALVRELIASALRLPKVQSPPTESKAVDL